MDEEENCSFNKEEKISRSHNPQHEIENEIFFLLLLYPEIDFLSFFLLHRFYTRFDNL